MSESTNPKKWAILIGINFYLLKENRLHGAVNDVEDIEELLLKPREAFEITKFVAPVTGEEGQSAPPGLPQTWPTYENITERIKYVTSRASKGDLVYIHYSGHGTQKNSAGDLDYRYREQGATDSALALFDSQNTDKVRYLRGIELAKLLDLMVAKGIVVSIVLDCCHSGGVSRGDCQTRGIPWSATTAMQSPMEIDGALSSSFQQHDAFRDGIANPHWLLKPEGYTLLAACGPYEKAKEVRDERYKRHNGALTFHLIEAVIILSQRRVELTYETIIRRIQAKFYISYPHQNPLLMGTQPAVFLVPAIETGTERLSCEVIGVDENGLVSLNIGRAHGVSVDDVYDIHRPKPYQSGPQTPERSTPCSMLVVRNVESLHCDANWDSNRHLAPRVEVGMAATLAAMKKPKAHVRLLPGMTHAWIEEIESSPWIQIVNSDEHLPAQTPCFSIKLANGAYEIVMESTGQTMNIPKVQSTDEDSPMKTRRHLEHLAKYFFEMALDNIAGHSIPDNHFNISISPPDSVTSGFSPGDDRLTIEDGQRVYVTFHNSSSEALYVTVLDFKPSFAVTKVWPRDRDHAVIGPSGQKSFKIKMFIPDPPSGNLKPREITDTFKFIITNRPMRVAGLTLADPWKTSQYFRGTDESRLLQSLLQGISSPMFDEHAHTLPVMRGQHQNRLWTCRDIHVHTMTNI